MIIFELTMPHVNTWNGHWSGEDLLYIRKRSEREVPKELWGKDFYYRWPDGWGACVSVRRMRAKEAARLEKKSAGFCGYDWMIRSLINNGCIRTEASTT